jgi:hypothetical protein
LGDDGIDVDLPFDIDADLEAGLHAGRQAHPPAFHHLRNPGFRGEAGGLGVGEPAVVQSLVGYLRVILGGPGGQHRPPTGAAALLGGEAAPEDLLGLGHGDPCLALHRPAPLGVVLDQSFGHAHDVGLAVAVDGSPHHPQAGLGLGSQGGVVDEAGRLELSVHAPGVQRPPDVVLAAHPGRDQDVGVQLRIARPGGAVYEGGPHQAVGVHVADAGLARAGERGVVLQILQSRSHRRVMGLPGGHAHLGPAQGPQAGQGLRREKVKSQPVTRSAPARTV